MTEPHWIRVTEETKRLPMGTRVYVLRKASYLDLSYLVEEATVRPLMAEHGDYTPWWYMRDGSRPIGKDYGGDGDIVAYMPADWLAKLPIKDR